jgi:hypothetical protein
MSHRRTFAAVMLVVGLTLPLASCASGKLRLSSAKMCQANGGTYDTSKQTCSYTASTLSAKQTCEMHGGYYDPDAQVCQIGVE